MAFAAVHTFDSRVSSVLLLFTPYTWRRYVWLHVEADVKRI